YNGRCYMDFCVPEYGISGACLHFLWVHFFLTFPTDSLDLHSFPTRRSSDLRARPSADHVAGRLPRHGDQLADRCPGQARPRKSSDRKSTRLNSSHLGISYAVFCLKKKTISISLIMSMQQLMAVYL